jgi:purE: phosphoribosylaminoimidazole carboxylase, catalytic subunit
MKKVGIVMGSDSDMPVMSKAAAILDKLGVEYEMKIISAHREPDVFLTMQRVQRKEDLR